MSAPVEFHEDCGMPLSSHALACPGTFISEHEPTGISRPNTAAEWVSLIEWAVDGLREEMSKQ